MYIILGGTSGLGLELADQWRRLGERVVVLGRAHDASAHGEGLAVDLFYQDRVAMAISRLDDLVIDQSIDGFVWSAGYGWRGNFEDQTDAHAMAEVNFAGAMTIVQWAWRKMIAQQHQSQLIVIGSTSSVKARADEAVYVATKHAQAGLARSLGIQSEEQQLPIKVSLFLPGGMKTRFWDGREKPTDYDSFNDPIKIAEHIIESTNHQAGPYLEWAFPKGALV